MVAIPKAYGVCREKVVAGRGCPLSGEGEALSHDTVLREPQVTGATSAPGAVLHPPAKGLAAGAFSQNVPQRLRVRRVVDRNREPALGRESKSGDGSVVHRKTIDQAVVEAHDVVEEALKGQSVADDGDPLPAWASHKIVVEQQLVFHPV